MSGETEEAVSGWTTDTLKAHMDVQFTMLRTMLDERYATQSKALDAAFVAQQVAMQTALTSAEKAVATALTSAEKAVAKAETAAEKRFESVNEFRAQLSDQNAEFITRREYEAKHETVVAQVAQVIKTQDESKGRSTGVNSTVATLLAMGGLFVTVVIAVVAVIGTR